eukprot:Em0207g4a
MHRARFLAASSIPASVCHAWLKLQKECRTPSCFAGRFGFSTCSITFGAFGLFRSDGVSIVPWKCGQLLVWNATCTDTLAPSYSTIAAHQVGAVAQQAEDRKMHKYKHLPMLLFHSSGNRDKWSFWTKDNRVPEELGHRLRQVSGEANSFAYLTQRLSVAVQRGNAASVLGTIKMDSEEEEFLVPKLLYCMSE